MRRHLSRAWWASIVVLLLLALLLTAARLALHNIDRFRPALQDYLSRKLGVELSIDQLQGHWSRALPVVQISGIRMRVGAEHGPEGYLAVDDLLLRFDPFRSLFRGTPIFEHFEARGVVGRWHQRDGAWLHRPGASPRQPESGMSDAGWRALSGLLLSQPYALIADVELLLIPEQGGPVVITPADLELENTRREHRLSGSFRMPQLGDSTALSFVLETGELGQQDPLAAHYRGYVDIRNLGPQLAQLLWPEWQLTALDADSRIWVDIGQRQLLAAQAELNVNQLQVGHQALPVPETLATRLSIQPWNDQYQLQINDLTLTHGEQVLSLPRLLLNAPLQPRLPDAFELGVASLDLSAAADWLRAAGGTESPLARVLEQLAPEGALHNLQVTRKPGQPLQDLELIADVEDAGVEAWHGAPALEGVSGRLRADRHGGEIDLVSRQFGMHFPRLYPDKWRYTHASGRVRWQLSQQGVHVSSERLQLKDQAVQASGRFSIDLPFDREQQSELILMIGMTDSDGLKAPVYTPEREVGAGLHRWLKGAIRSGRLKQGGLVLRTGTRQLDTPRRPVVQLFFDIEDAALAYQEGWPQIEQADLFVMVRDAGVAINIDQGQLLDTRIDSGWAYLAPGSRTLQIEALLQGPADDVDHVLKRTPLADALGPAIQSWQLAEGSSTLHLGLGVPLEADKVPEVRVAAQLDGAVLRSESAGIQVTNLQGGLEYQTGVGLSSDQLNGIFLRQPVTAQIEPSSRGHQIHLIGRTGISDLDRWLDSAGLTFASGDLNWQGELTLCGEDACNRLELSSDLQGVELSLPGRLSKPASVPAPLSLGFELTPELNLQKGMLQLPVQGMASPMQVSLSTPEQTLQVGLQHEWVAGTLKLPPGAPIGVDLEHLQLDLLRAPEKDAGTGATPAEAKDPHYSGMLEAARVPDLNLRVAHLELGEKPLGDWRFQLRPDDDGLRVTGLEAHLEQLILRGEANWHQRQESPQTALTLKLAADDIGRLLQQWGYGRIMETREVTGTLQLDWPGAPWDFALGNLGGEFLFETGQTRLIETADSSNLLRVFGILNFNSLARRLRLDFSDLLQKGISFDAIRGDYRLKGGVAVTRSPLVLEGPSADMRLTGQVDLTQEQLDQEVEVTLPLSSNAPFAAILLGAPQVAGAAFVIDKLIGDKLQRFSTLKYTLKGHWDDPEMKLQPPATE
ncbi:hypothetical protein H9C73_08630 [Marinobacterium sp. AK62]|uniref:YhdP central domain-containing protein n=1 Tax=Marinobacterium alkalitolerans TaxID=1542925 RepID=A0ABS3ZAS5_9GAMM|nr:AsmA-like C-terminal region-containing protein [Marinobacterium alkalitolerans]MBP0048803.1 hypothetical protein [Marinobacterium alkalitolerans]